MARPLRERTWDRLEATEDAEAEHLYWSGTSPYGLENPAGCTREQLGLDPDLVRHGIKREVYTMPLTENFRDVKGFAKHAATKRPSV